MSNFFIEMEDCHFVSIPVVKFSFNPFAFQIFEISRELQENGQVFILRADLKQGILNEQ